MADRIAILDDGVLQQVAPPQDVYERPANLFVARFIGSPPMNTVHGQVVPAAPVGHAAVEVDGATVELPDPLSRALADVGAQTATLGVRPEHLRLGADGPLRATVSVIESLGHERHVFCRLSTDEVLIARFPSDAPVPGEGSAVRLAAEAEHLHLFDTDTGQRIEPA